MVRRRRDITMAPASPGFLHFATPISAMRAAMEVVHETMAGNGSMTLSGRDLHAILGVALVYENVPFKVANKRPLSGREIAAIDSLRASVTAARNSLVPRLVGQWTPADRQRMLDRSVELELDAEQVALLEEIARRCLAEFGSDFAMRPFLNPDIGRREVEALWNRMSTLSLPTRTTRH
jgi:hypothetical protein